MRVNEEITAREVLVIGDGDERIGVLPIGEALRMAQERGADLVEVAPAAVPPVCRFLNYGKFKYEHDRKQRQSRRSQHEVSMREVRIRPQVAGHDFQFKMRLVQRLLHEGDRVKLSVIFRGRQMDHMELGRDLMNRAIKELEDVAMVERPLALEGRNMSVILSLSKKVKAVGKGNGA
ncbi:MAG: translation initiation factor IF-3 [Chloroflexi bacterium]|nr:translation initiation factor IF-3 [Chloroflexota bacterium]